MKFSPYSHSKITSYENCPYAFKFKYIDKIKITLDPRFFEKGNFYHKVLECYPDKEVKFNWEYNDEVKQKEYLQNIYEFIQVPHVQNLLANRFGAELEFKFDEALAPTEISKWKSGLYGYIDFIGAEDNEIFIVDWKSKDHGERFPANKKQLQMYAAWIFAVRPKLQKVTCEFAYIENKTFETFEYTREDGKIFIDDIINRINTIEKDTKFEKNVRKECSNCDYFKQCKPFNVKTK